MFNPKKMHHVGFGVRNYEESIKFYTEVLGLELVFKNENMAHVRLGESTLELFRTENHSESATDQVIGLRHFSIGVVDVHEAYETLKAKGVQFYIEPNENGDYAFFRDPDNISIEINRI